MRWGSLSNAESAFIAVEGTVSSPGRCSRRGLGSSEWLAEGIDAVAPTNRVRERASAHWPRTGARAADASKLRRGARAGPIGHRRASRSCVSTSALVGGAAGQEGFEVLPERGQDRPRRPGAGASARATAARATAAGP